MNKDRITPAGFITELKENEVFVFGSNVEGKHKGGAAWTAFEKFGAIWEEGEGEFGNSYAIPTVELWQPRNFEGIAESVNTFIDHAKNNPEKTYLVTEIGCGIAGFDVQDIAPLFEGAWDVHNISLPESFWRVIVEQMTEQE